MPNLLRYDASQGSTSQIDYPAWSGDASGNWTVIVSFVCTSFASTPRVLGSTTSASNRALVLGTTGFLSWVTVGIAGAAGSISLNTRYWVKLESVGATKNLYQSTDGVNYTLVGTASYSAANMDWARLGSASTTRSQVFDFYSIDFSGSTYTDSFDGTTAPSSGTSWPSVGGTRNITLTNFANTTSCWVSYGASFTELASVSSSVSFSDAELETAITLSAQSVSYSFSSAGLVAGSTLLSSSSFSLSESSAALFTQINFSANSFSLSESTALLDFDADTLRASSLSENAVNSDLFTQITFASISATLSISQANLSEETTAKYLQRYDNLSFNNHELFRSDGTTFKKHPLMRKTDTGWEQYNG